MQLSDQAGVIVQHTVITSAHLDRDVHIDLYPPPSQPDANATSLLLINDGQDLPKFYFDTMLRNLYEKNEISPIFCVGIYCSPERKMEYGTASILDYKGRGAKAKAHQDFVFEELMPYLNSIWKDGFIDKAYAGFSLGGLSAIDAVWHHPKEFSKTGVFSGSLWWRLRDIRDGYNEQTDRIIHKLIRQGEYKPGLKFYFTTGSLDEKMDRNNNGVIDSIDDTLGLIEELEKKGYVKGVDISYINYEDGKHDVKTWGRAMPGFLKWGWGEQSAVGSR